MHTRLVTLKIIFFQGIFDDPVIFLNFEKIQYLISCHLLSVVHLKDYEWSSI